MKQCLDSREESKKTMILFRALLYVKTAVKVQTIIIVEKKLKLRATRG